MRARLQFESGSTFLADVRCRVDAYFASSGTARTANAAMWLKAVLFLSAAASLFAVAVVLPFPLSLLPWTLLGVVLAGIGFNVGHDAIHGSFSRHARVNRVLALTFDLIGASSATWTVAHNQVHHSFTNIVGADDDIEPGPWMRFHPDPAPPRYTRLQHLYAWFLYGLTGVVWVFYKDFAQLRTQRASARVVAQVVAGKLAHFALFIGVPLALGVAPLAVVCGYLAMLVAAGFTLAIVFQLAHVVEGVSFPEAPGNGRMPLSWAEHQLMTTADFGRTSITTFLTGALDHQIEHHLFPRICHIHYEKLAPIVAACARDHGLSYRHSGGFVAALASHARMLRALGQPAQRAPEFGLLVPASAARQTAEATRSAVRR